MKDKELWFENHYTCPKCGELWYSEWSSACDDECPRCGEKDISPDNSVCLIRPDQKEN